MKQEKQDLEQKVAELNKTLTELRSETEEKDQKAQQEIQVLIAKVGTLESTHTETATAKQSVFFFIKSSSF